MKTQAQIDYENDVKEKPNYPDGTPRKKWEELSPIARFSWGEHAIEKMEVIEND